MTQMLSLPMEIMSLRSEHGHWLTELLLLGPWRIYCLPRLKNIAQKSSIILIPFVLVMIFLSDFLGQSSAPLPGDQHLHDPLIFLDMI